MTTWASEPSVAAEPGSSGAGLVRLGSSGESSTPADDDLRGLVVLDPHGLRLGEVEDLVVDARHRRTRFLVVVSGGLSGLVRTWRLVPVEAVERVTDVVRVAGAQEHPRVLVPVGAEHLDDESLLTAAHDHDVIRADRIAG